MQQNKINFQTNISRYLAQGKIRPVVNKLMIPLSGSAKHFRKLVWKITLAQYLKNNKP